MGTYILTSMFPNGFGTEVTELFRQIITKRNKFAFVASEFEEMHEMTDGQFEYVVRMFYNKGIYFEKKYVVDGRMTSEEVQKVVQEADVVWLAGGDAPKQCYYLKKYGLDKIIRQHNGIIIGMSAGSVNLGQTVICDAEEIYEGLGCVNISTAPHFIRSEVESELLELSEKYEIYGLCDDSIIICKDGKTDFYGEVYKIRNGNLEQIK